MDGSANQGNYGFDILADIHPVTDASTPGRPDSTDSTDSTDCRSRRRAPTPRQVAPPPAPPHAWAACSRCPPGRCVALAALLAARAHHDVVARRRRLPDHAEVHPPGLVPGARPEPSAPSSRDGFASPGGASVIAAARRPGSLIDSTTARCWPDSRWWPPPLGGGVNPSACSIRPRSCSPWHPGLAVATLGVSHTDAKLAAAGVLAGIVHTLAVAACWWAAAVGRVVSSAR